MVPVATAVTIHSDLCPAKAVVVLLSAVSHKISTVLPFQC